MIRKLLFGIVIISLLAGIKYYLSDNFNIETTDLIAIENLEEFTETKDTEALSQNNASPSKTMKAQNIEIPAKFLPKINFRNKQLTLPENYTISVFATGFSKPRGLAILPDGEVYMADKSRGTIYYLKDSDNDATSNIEKEVITGLRNPHGVEYFEGDLYVTEETRLWVLKNISEGEFDEKVLLVDNFPGGETYNNHVTRTVRIGPDKKMYVSIGSSCNVCEETDKRRAAIVRYDLDGSNEEIYAQGLRNTVDFVFDNEGKMWGVNNGRDNIGDDLPSEEINIIEETKHYGWPFCYDDGLVSPEYSNAGKSDFCLNDTEFPIYKMQAHSAPLGMTFSPWVGEERTLIIGFHGSWNRTEPTGYKIVKIDTSDGDAQTQDFITGWIDDNNEVWGRPVDVKVYKSNQLLITDDLAGVIYLVKPN